METPGINEEAGSLNPRRFSMSRDMSKEMLKEVANDAAQDAPRNVERTARPRARRSKSKAADARSPKRSARRPRRRLKPERVQEELRAEGERVREALKALPGWRVISRARGIERISGFPAAPVASAYSAFVSGFADEVGQRCSIEQAQQHVTVTLFGRRRNAVTKAVLDFARRLG